MATLGAVKIPIKVVSKGVGKAIGAVKSSLKSLVSLPGLGALFGGGLAVRELLNVGDAYINLDAQLTSLTGSAEEAADIQEELFQLSQRTGTSVLANADAFTKLRIAEKRTGLTTAENIEVLEGLNKIFALSGASALDTSISMRQLGQSLASGVLQGDEFRSMAEATPMLLVKLAESLKVPVGELKKMGSEGKLTSEILGKAFLEISRGSELAFTEMPKTSARAFQRIINSAQRLWDNILDNTGLISFISDKFDEVAVWIENNQDRFTGWAWEAKEFIVENWEIISKKGMEMMDQLIRYTEEWGPHIKLVFEDAINLAAKLLPHLEELATIMSFLASGNILGDPLALTEEDKARLGKTFDFPSQLGSGGGSARASSVTINNNLANKMTPNDIMQLNTEQQRQASRS